MHIRMPARPAANDEDRGSKISSSDRGTFSRSSCERAESSVLRATLGRGVDVETHWLLRPHGVFTVTQSFGLVLGLLLYAIFYLFVLDRLGVHFYPIFSPRSHFSSLGYVLIFAIYYLCYTSANWIVTR